MDSEKLRPIGLPHESAEQFGVYVAPEGEFVPNPEKGIHYVNINAGWSEEHGILSAQTVVINDEHFTAKHIAMTIVGNDREVLAVADSSVVGREFNGVPMDQNRGAFGSRNEVIPHAKRSQIPDCHSELGVPHANLRLYENPTNSNFLVDESLRGTDLVLWVAKTHRIIATSALGAIYPAKYPEMRLADIDFVRNEETGLITVVQKAVELAPAA